MLRDYLNVTCAKCGGSHVKAYLRSDRALIVCEDCGEPVFRFYRDPERQRRGEAPEALEDAFHKRLAVREVLGTVSPGARAVFEYVQRFRQKYPYGPTLREIQRDVGLPSTTVWRHLNELEEADLITRVYGLARSTAIKHVG